MSSDTSTVFASAPATTSTGATAAAPAPRAQPASANATQPILSVKNLVGGYYKQEVVHGIDFEVQQGEFVCLIGANGCGKTTVLKMLLGLLAPSSGEVFANGTATSKLKEKELAKVFAYIPQAHTPPFPFEVADVVLLGRTPYINRMAIISDEDKQIAYDALCQLGIEHLAKRTYTKLSGGQQQLVLIARALAQQPRLLIMDEPTASLDFGNQQMVLSRMQSLARGGVSVLMVTHDPDHALYCADRVIMMENGLIIGDGPTAEVINTENLQRIYSTSVVVVDVEVMPGRMERVCVPLNPTDK